MIRPALSSSSRAIARATPATKVHARFASGGQSYNQPSGYLFGEKPPAKGQKRVKQDWENMWYYGFFGSLGLAGVLLFFKPDTSIQSWAMVEAKKRLEASGDTWQYQPSPNSGHPNGA